MAISSEFAHAVRENNLLRVRIMLKDSLLLDKTFRLFDEMQAYAATQEVSPWADADIPLEKAEKPWSEDTMNYELTALVNDFTKEHVNYVKAIITEIFKSDLPQTRQAAQQGDIRLQSTHCKSTVRERVPVKSAMREEDPHEAIEKSFKQIGQILRRNRDGRTGHIRWYSEDVGRIRRYAQKIVDACDRLQRRM